MFPLVLFGQGITFEKGSFEEALAKAKQEDKLLFVDGYAIWCAPCKKMAKTVFMEAEVGDYFDEHLIAITLDIERGNGPELKKKYGIKGLPGYVFVDGNDEVVYRFDSAMPTEEFLEEVKRAVAYSKDPVSLGRLAERYEAEKSNEDFLATYLQKLGQSKEKGYADVLEQYLTVQTSFADSSREMVMLLAEHHAQIIIGGEAERIINENMTTETWRKYVRKDIREIFQQLPKEMLNQTSDYAVKKCDTTYLEMAFIEAKKNGVRVDAKQRKGVYIDYFYRTEQGDRYKALVKPEIEAYMSALDVEDLRNNCLSLQQRKQEGDSMAQLLRPKSVRVSQEIISMVKPYAKFVTTEEDKEDALKWIHTAYYIFPGDYSVMNEYATALYLYSDKKEEAIKIKKEAYLLAEEDDSKRSGSFKADLDAMIAGEEINFL